MVIDEREHAAVGDGVKIKGRRQHQYLPGMADGADEFTLAVDERSVDIAVEGLGTSQIEGPLGAEARLGRRVEESLPAGVEIGGDIVGRVENRPAIQVGQGALQVKGKIPRSPADRGAEAFRIP